MSISEYWGGHVPPNVYYNYGLDAHNTMSHKVFDLKSVVEGLGNTGISK